MECCSICLKEIKNSVKLKKCNHKYCNRCINKWLYKGIFFVGYIDNKLMNYAKCPQCRMIFTKKDIIKEKLTEKKRENLDIYKRTRISTRLARSKIVYVKLRELLNNLEMKEEQEDKIIEAIEIFKYLYENKWFLKKSTVYESGVEYTIPMFKEIIKKKLNEFIKIDKRFNEWEYKLRESLK